MKDLRETAQALKRRGLRNAESFEAARVADHYLSVLDELAEARSIIRALDNNLTSERRQRETLMQRHVLRYIPTEHLCCTCGVGRIMQQVNGGPSGGGNPTWRCMTCMKGSAAISPKGLCYCGYKRYSEEDNEYRCWDIFEHPIPEGYEEFRAVHNLCVIRRVKP